MQNNPITSDVVKHIKGLEKRLSVMENRPTGTIVVDKQIITTDPSTGVKTVIGNLASEGEERHGIMQWVGDVEPPPVPSTPIVTSQMGLFTLIWDGANENLLPHAPDFSHIKLYGTQGTSTFDVGIIKTGQESAIYSETQSGEVWTFWATSVDFNGNESAASVITDPIAVVSSVEDPDIAGALQKFKEDIATAESIAASADAMAGSAWANSAAVTAQVAAATAQSASAWTVASAASAMAVSATARAASADANAASAWTASKTATAVAASADAKAASALTVASAASADAVTASVIAASADANASSAWAASKSATAAAQAATAQSASAWTVASAASANAVSATAVAASADANAKSATAQAASALSAAKSATAVAASATSQASSAQSQAQSAYDQAVAATQTATGAVSVANGKNTVWFTTPPASGNTIGDTYYKDTEQNRMYQWDGSAWVSTTYGASALSANSITAAHITASAITAGKLAANSVVAANITSGNINATHIASQAITATAIAAQSISSTAIAANSITATALAAQSITATALAALSITATAIAGNSITATAIRADQIAASHIVANAITTSHIKSLSIAASHIVSNAITADELAATSVAASHIRAGVVDATHIKSQTITATALAAQSITASAIKAQTITASALAAGSITASAIASQTITATALAAQSITASAIKSQTITATALAADSITASAIRADNIAASHIVANAITTSHIKSGSIAASHIVSNAITADELAASSVTASHIRGAVITAVHLASNSITATAIRADQIAASHIVADAITTSHIAAGTISAEKLAVGVGPNMFPDPLIKNLEEWAGTGISVVTNGGRNASGNSMRITSAAAQRGTYYGTSITKNRIQTIPGRTYLLTAWIKPSVATTVGTNISMYGRLYPQVGTSNTWTTPSTINAKYITDKATIAAGSWVKFEAALSVPEDSVNTFLVPGFFIQSGYPSGATLDWCDISVTEMASGELIVDGSITALQISASAIEAQHIKTNAITADKISAGAVGASHIEAGSINATKLSIGVGNNLITDPLWGNDALTSYRCLTSNQNHGNAGWYKTSNYLRTASSTASGNYGFRMRSESAGSTYDDIPVVSGTRYNITYDLFSSSAAATGTTRMAFYIKRLDGTTGFVGDTSGAGTSSNAQYPITSNWKTYTREYLVPADVISLCPVIQMNATNYVSGAYMALRNVSMVPMADGTLIVNGAIDGKTITGSLFQTSGTANRGIKLDGVGTNNSLKAWNSSGVETFSLDGTTGELSMAGEFNNGTSGNIVTISRPKITLQNEMTSQIIFHLPGNVRPSSSMDTSLLPLTAAISSVIDDTSMMNIGPSTDIRMTTRGDSGNFATTSLVVDSFGSGTMPFFTTRNAHSALISTTAYKVGTSINYKNSSIIVKSSSRGETDTYVPRTSIDMEADNVTVNAETLSTPRLRLTATDDASETSTLHPLQLGSTSGLNVILDNNELMALNGTARSTYGIAGSSVSINGNITTSGSWIAYLDWAGKLGRAGLKISGTESYFQVEGMWTTTSAANAYLNTSGTLYRSTSSRKNKLSVEDLSPDRDELILGLKARTWFDKRQSEELAEFIEAQSLGEAPENENLPYLRRVPGMVAEEVEAAGLTEFVQYGIDGEVEGLMYDRLGVALIPVVGRLRDRVVELERKIDLLLAQYPVVE